MNPAKEARPGVAPWQVVAALAVAEVAWLVWALNVPLINANSSAKPGDPKITRSFFLLNFFPGVIPGVSWRESFLGGAVENLSHVENLPQRWPIVGAGTLIVASGLALGTMALRALGFHRRWSRLERLAVGFGLGMTGLGLFALLMGRAGWLTPWSARIGLSLPIVAAVIFLIRDRLAGAADSGPEARESWLAIAGLFLVVGPFLVVMALGSMLPTIDFDAIEYHLEGPKEYFLAGKIAFLPYNVYTSMPFGVEMLHLLGMHVLDDWWLGALAGQLVVANFAPMAGLAVWLTARRWGSPRAAWFAAAVYLTTPWIYRLAAIPYVEGPLCYYHAALAWAAGMAWGESAEWRNRGWLVVGGLAGGAMAIKYPALVSAVVPFGVAAIVATWKGWFAVGEDAIASASPPPYPPPQGGRVSEARRSQSSPSSLVGEGRVGGRPTRSLLSRLALNPITSFSLGVLLVMAPWLIKNTFDTGNPVYPLGYRVFGGRDWDAAREAKWSNAHGPKPVEMAALKNSILEVAAKSDWQSLALFALAPLAFVRPGSRRAARAVGGFVLYLFFTWWLFTHRLDRFWLPLLPGLAVLAGFGADWTRGRAWTGIVALVLTISITTSAAQCSTDTVGFHEWTGDLRALRTTVPSLINPPLARLDAELPPDAKPLLVGQAMAFHMRHRVVYNTVFDRDSFETIDRDQSPEAVREELARRGITHIYVDWSEIERYRSPGNYGYTDYVTSARFARLVAAGVLSARRMMGPSQELYTVLPGR